MKKLVLKKAKKGTVVKKGCPPNCGSDSTAYYQNVELEAYRSAARNMNSPKYSEQAFNRARQAGKDIARQSLKGKPGYDKNGFPIKKNKRGGSVNIRKK